jgi:uncharacterized membrane protein
MDVLTDGGRGSEYGAARTIWVAIGSLGPVLVGFIGDIGGFHTAFATLGGILVCAALLLWAQDSY